MARIFLFFLAHGFDALGASQDSLAGIGPVFWLFDFSRHQSPLEIGILPDFGGRIVFAPEFDQAPSQN